VSICGYYLIICAARRRSEFWRIPLHLEEIIVSEIVLLLGMFACGAAVGALSRFGPLSAWGALVFPVFLPPVGIGLGMAFC
jgi:hypothetical protein